MISCGKMALKSGFLYQYCGKHGKNWKRRYCILYEDGCLGIYHDDEHTGNSNNKITLHKCCKKISTGIECYKWNSIILPKGEQGLDCLFSIQVKSFAFKKDYTFAAESNKECDEWVSFMERLLFKSAMVGRYVDVFAEEMDVSTQWTRDISLRTFLYCACKQ